MTAAITGNNCNYDELSSDNYIISDEVWPPGFRFHPTDEELVLYYLKRKICRRRLKLDVLAQIDVYKHEPEELPGLSLLKNGGRQWFFFSPRDRKYPNGSRSNRATRHGYWKATGKDRTITCNSRNVGLKKTLVFYRGRAPYGARTDWVMHEYILDEDELKRCENAKDYYAIYKVFKKSGPGRKNGEQYGAPFREEDWVDDDCRAITCNTDHTDLAVHAKKVVVDNSCKDTKVDPFFDDINEIMNRLIPEPTPQPPDVDDFEKALSQFVGEEEFHSTLVNVSFGEATYAEQCTTYAVNSQQNDFETSFDVTHTTTSGLQTWDAPEVTSNNANTFNLFPVAAEEDFLEMNDLLAPGPAYEYDTFYDANIGLLPDTRTKPQEGGWVHQAGFQQQHYPESASLFGNEMCSYDPNTCLTTTVATNQGSVPLPPAGIVGTGNIGTESIQKQQSGKDQHVEGGVETQPQTQTQTQTQNQPWFSSTLWSFVESIPAAPASAAESALVNKAFLRMSSFSRVRISTKSTTLTARGTTSASASTCCPGACHRIKGFFLFSLLVAFFAVFCVFFSSKSSGKLHCRMSL